MSKALKLNTQCKYSVHYFAPLNNKKTFNSFEQSI